MTEATAKPAVETVPPGETRKRWLWRGLLGFIALWLALVTAAEFYWPGWVERTLSQQLSKKLGVDISMDKVTTDAFDGVLHIQGFKVLDQGRPLIGFRELHLDYSWLSIFSPTWLIEDARLVGPEIHVALSPEGKLNLMKLVPPPTAEKTEGPRWHVNQLSIEDGMLDFRDDRVAPARAFRLTPWAFSLKDIGTDSANGQAELHGDLNGGARLDWVGSIDLQPLQSRGRLQLQRLNLPDLMRWAPPDLPVRLSDGRFSLDLDYEALLDPEVKVTLRKSRVALDKLRIDAGDERIARLDQLHVEGISIAYPAARWGVDAINIKGGELQLVRERNGQMRLQKALAGQPKRKQVAPKTDEKPLVWAGSLKAADIDDINVRFSDASTSPTTELSLGPLSLKAVPQVQNGQDTLSLDLKTPLNEAGRLGVTGRVGMPSVRADGSTAQPFFTGHISADDLNLAALAGYVRQAAQVRLGSARLGLDGDAVWQPGSQPLWSWRGDIRLNALKLADARDNSRLLSADAITASGLNIQGEPNRVSLASLTLDRPFVRAVLFKDGQLNFATLANGAPATPAAATPAAPRASGDAGWPARLDNLVLRNGTLVFVDQGQDPAFTQAIRQFGGRISHVDVPGSKPATIDLKGEMPPLGKLAISGKAVPSDAMALDLALQTSDIDLTGMSTYSGRYAGYRIDKGRLDTQLRYSIQQRQLKAENKVVLKEFTWGASVDSPDATGLPVRLATALLKDVNGNIDIDLPLTGSLDDPQFRVWPLVWQTLGNLITKAAAAPFKLLGALAGGSDDVSQIGFATGSSALDATASERIGKLAGALKARPGLQLEVRGLSDPDADKAALIKAGRKETEVTPELLHRLASARANAIAGALAAAGVPAGQVFVLDAGDTAASNGQVMLGMSVKVP